MDHTMSQSRVDAIIENELPKLDGWCTPEKGKRMAELSRGASLCVELGVFGGRGLVAIALALADQGFGRADGIDPFTADACADGTNDRENTEWWRGVNFDGIARSAQEALYRLKLTPYASLIRMLSNEVVGFYDDGTVDVLHQDSNHSEEVSSREVALWTPKIRPGGYWIADDTTWPSTKKSQRELEALGFTELEEHTSWKVYQRTP